MAQRRAPNRDHEAVLVRQSDGSTWRPDVVVQVTPTYAWSLTDHPVEQGVVVSDHVQRQPTGVVISCVLTENPTRIGSHTGGPRHLQELVRWLHETADSDNPLVDIVTRRMGTWRNYVITGLPYTLDAVARLAFDLTLRELRVATATTVTITVEDVADDSAVGAPDEVDAGEQATTSTEEDEAAEEADQSVLSSLLDWL